MSPRLLDAGDAAVTIEFGDHISGELVARVVALERALDGVAAALLDRIEVADEVRALAAQARTSAIVLVALPPVGAGLFCLLDPGFAGVLFASPAGRTCLVAGLALDGAGAWTSRRMVRRAVGAGAVHDRSAGESAGETGMWSKWVWSKWVWSKWVWSK